DDIPKAGDKLVVLEDEQKAKDIANQRQQIRREQELRKSKHLSLDDLSRRLALGEVSDLDIIIKADVDGSIEALSGSLQKLSNEEVSVNRSEERRVGKECGAGGWEEEERRRR